MDKPARLWPQDFEIDVETYLAALEESIAEVESSLAESQDVFLSQVADRGRAFVRAVRTEIHGKNEAPDFLTHEEQARAVIEEVARRSVLRNLLADQGTLESQFLAQRRASVQCNEAIQRSGCVIILIPELQARPILQGRLVDDAGDLFFEVDVKADQLSAGDWVHIELFSTSPSESAERIMEATLGPASSGSLSESLRVPLATDVSQVCAKAVLHRSAISSQSELATESGNEPDEDCTATDASTATLMMRIPETTTTTK